MSLDQQLADRAQSFSVSFRQKIAVTFTLLIVFIMLVSVYLVTIQIKDTSLGRAQDSGRLLGRMIALSMGEDIIRGNFQLIDYSLKEFVKLKKIDYCMIIDNQGRIISSTQPGTQGKYFSDAWSRSALYSSDLSIRRARGSSVPVYDTSVPIIIGGKRYGLIRAGFTIDDEYDHIRNLLFYNLSLGAVLILVGLLIAYGISATLLSPLNSILKSIESISHGDYTYKATVKSSDEFGELASSFNRLSSILQDRETTSSFISRKIFESDPALASRNFSGKPVEAVVLHFELYRFNNYVERSSPSEAVDTLNRFLTQTSEIIARAYGLIDKLGDGFITAVFPINKNDSWPAPLRAGFAALSARDNFNIFNYKAARLGLEELNMQLGLSCGQVIIGHIGTRARSDFSAIGPRLAGARKAAGYSGRKNGFLPIADQAFVTAARDYLLFKPARTEETLDTDNDTTDYFTITGFANLAYFCERLKAGASERSLTSVIQAFGLTGCSEGFSFLKKYIEDPACTYRREAIKSLSPFMFQQNDEAKEYLRNLTTSSEEPEIKSVAVSILGLARDQQMAGYFMAMFTDADDRVRANAVEAYIPLDVPEKREQLKKLVNDKAPRVCANALLGLWLADDQQTLTCLYDLLKSDNSGKRSSAAYAVYFLAASRKFRRLFPGYCEQPGLTTLSIIDNIFIRLKQMLESQENSERYQALRAIGRIGDLDCREPILHLLQDETDPEIINLGHSILSDWEKSTGNQADLPRARIIA